MSAHLDFRETKSGEWEVWCHDYREWFLITKRTAYSTGAAHPICCGCGRRLDDRIRLAA